LPFQNLILEIQDYLKSQFTQLEGSKVFIFHSHTPITWFENVSISLALSYALGSGLAYSLPCPNLAYDNIKPILILALLTIILSQSLVLDYLKN
jgi:hypothetical protein